MDILILVALLVVSVIFNLKQYKELNSNSKAPAKKSAYKKSWEDGGKAKKTWKAKK